MNSIGRQLVLVIGDSDIDLIPFTQRQLDVRRVTIEASPTYFNEALAVVVADFPDKFGLIKDCYTRIFPQAEDHGLAPLVIVHSQANHVQVDALRKKDFASSVSRIFSVGEIWRAAEYAARHRVGPPAGNVRIEPDSIKLSEDGQLLLRRAFSDCERIYLEQLFGGKASTSVFRVHAWLKQSEVGPRPLPFFVKLATPELVDEEKRKYRDYAEHYIPFNLRPNLDRGRCVHTRSLAALVGNFVDDAVPLRMSLRSGHGVGALFALFESSLKGFRVQPFTGNKEAMKSVLAGFARERIGAERLPQTMLDHAHSFGLEKNVLALRDIVCAAAGDVACYYGPYHGDLHSGNVMVRNGDAILIDFSSAGHGPLTADPAALEVSLMFGTDEQDKPDCFPDWRQFIDQIYGGTNSTLHPSALFENEPGPFSWLRRSLRELRHILLGCDTGTKEAKIVLAAYLLRYGRLSIEELPDDRYIKLASDRHAYALVIAERILNTM